MYELASLIWTTYFIMHDSLIHHLKDILENSIKICILHYSSTLTHHMLLKSNFQDDESIIHLADS